MARILLADDEEDFRASVAVSLRVDGHEVLECGSADEAIERLRVDSADIVMTDLRMPGRSGLELLRETAARSPDCILIVMTAYGSLESAIEALRIGAHDFILKPVSLEALRRKVNFLAEHQAALAENRFLRGSLGSEFPGTGLVGTSENVAQVHRLIARVAPTDSTVLIVGETGTGKELVARAVHEASPRRDRPFVAINCGSIPDTLLESELFGHARGAFTGADRDKRGLFEVAGGGSIFLDEIGEMPLSVQPKILRALESREILRVGSTAPIGFTARIIAATHRNLGAMVESGAFRSDLYYRLNVFEIPITPLRERPQDVQPIAGEVLARLCRRLNRPVPVLEPDALRAMEQYAWPGNVRELANVLERALILTDAQRITVADLPGVFVEQASAMSEDLKLARQTFERDHIRRVMALHGGDKRRAAEALGIDLSSLYRKLEE